MDKSIYLDWTRILSYNVLLYMILAERGVGKSYGAKKFCISHYKKKHKKFAWLRRYASDLESAIGNKEHPEFFNDIKREFPKNEFGVNTNGKINYLTMDDETIGYAMSLRSAESLKGTAFDDVDTIILDEFLVGDGGSRYLKDEPLYLLSIIESIARLRNIRVILLGNSTSTVNPYFDFFNVHIPYNSEYQVFKDNTILVAYLKNQAYRDAKKESKFGKLVADTKYEKYAINNEFINDSNTFIKKKPAKARLFCNIIINNTVYGVWMDKLDMFVSSKYNPNYSVNVTFDFNSHDEKTLLLKSRNVFMQNITKHYRYGVLYFENQQIKHAIMDLLKKTRSLY
jgi:hypothetical protein